MKSKLLRLLKLIHGVCCYLKVWSWIGECTAVCIDVTSFSVFHTEETVPQLTANGLRHARGPVHPSNRYIDCLQQKMSNIHKMHNPKVRKKLGYA